MADTFRITEQRRQSVLADGVNPTIGYRVYFTITETGALTFVDVPDRDYTPETVRALIDAEVERHLAVQNL